MVLYIFIFVSAVFISSVSQILLKKSAGKQYAGFIKEYLNPLVIIAYGLFFAATLITLYAYKVIPLSLGPILESSGYLWVSLLSFIFLKEKIRKMKMLGILVILIGIFISVV